MSTKNEQPSRRDMLRWSALASTGVVVAACNGSNGSDAGDASLTDSGTDTNPTDTGTDAGGNAAVISILNALLAAEWSAIAAYTAGAGILAAPPAGDPLGSSAPILLAVATHFQSQHMAHAGALQTAITGLGGTPVAQSSVSFSAPPTFTPTVANVLKLACNAEKAAAIAYNGTVPQLTVANNLRFLAGSILGDETQHFVVLYALLTQTAGAGPNIATGANLVAPTDFVSTVGTDMGLESVTDFTYA